MESVSLDDIVRSLREVGLKRGDIVNFHSRLFSIGSVRGATVPQIPQYYLQAIREVITEEGTIVVPTYTTSFGRFGTPFILEESPSEFGVFSEHVRQSPGSFRSLHPVHSLTALGGQAKVLTEEHPPWNVGHDTVYDRMLKRSGKIVALGLPLRECLSFVHHVELIACVPYLYHKVFRGEVFAYGAQIESDFFMPVRYLNYDIAYDLSKLETALTRKGAITETSLGGDQVQAVSMEAVIEVLISALSKDPYFLLESAPNFVEGEIPLDGTTIQREGSAPNYFLTG